MRKKIGVSCFHQALFAAVPGHGARKEGLLKKEPEDLRQWFWESRLALAGTWRLCFRVSEVDGFFRYGPQVSFAALRTVAETQATYFTCLGYRETTGTGSRSGLFFI